MIQSKILVVDDIPENISLLYDLLLGQGYEVFIALDGEHAIELAHKIQPDLILLDSLMPGMDGFETCRRLKSESQTQEIPVIFMTATDDAEERAEELLRDGADYLTKPVHQQQMLVRIRMQLEMRGLRAQAEATGAEVRHLCQLLHGASGWLRDAAEHWSGIGEGNLESTGAAARERARDLAWRARFLLEQLSPVVESAQSTRPPDSLSHAYLDLEGESEAFGSEGLQ